ncbi:MAG: methyltransferase [Myxococcota bacterium]
MSSGGGPGEPQDPAERLLRLLGGKWTAAAIAAAASLGLADALGAEPRTPGALADALGCDAGALERLLRVLAGEGLVEEGSDGRFGLTCLGAELRSDAMGDLAAFAGAPFAWHPWAALADAVRTGRSAFEHTHGQDLWTYLDARPEEARAYHAAIDAFTRHEARALAARFDFGSVGTVVDVGGGIGTLLLELLARWPSLRGVLLERPPVAEQAQARLTAAGVEDRCEAVAGDFLEAVPPGGDAYVIKRVLHNWPDAEATRILRHCAEAVRPGGHVLVIEGVVLPGNRRDPARLLDLEMLALCGPGRARGKPDLRRLFHAAGLKLERTSDLAGTTRLLVTTPK